MFDILISSANFFLGFNTFLETPYKPFTQKANSFVDLVFGYRIGFNNFIYNRSTKRIRWWKSFQATIWDSSCMILENGQDIFCLRITKQFYYYRYISEIHITLVLSFTPTFFLHIACRHTLRLTISTYLYLLIIIMLCQNKERLL